MPTLEPQQATSSTSFHVALSKQSRNPLTGRELTSERKFKETPVCPEERKLDYKSPPHYAATRRGKKLRKGNQKPEVQFAIKSSKAKRLKLCDTFSPIRRKLRNFKC